MTSYDTSFLFDDVGKLRLELFSKQAQEVLFKVREWLCSRHRRMFLPLDLLIILIERGSKTLAHVISEGTEGVVLPGDLLVRLQALADEIEEEPSDEETDLSRPYFSRGFTRILAEAAAQARARDNAIIQEEDLVRSITWRAEAVESASVRWAIRRLGEGGGDRIFDEKGLLRASIFSNNMWEVLQGAMRLAASHGTPFLGTPHLVAMLCTVKNSTLWRSAKVRGFEPHRLRDELLRLIGNRSEAIPEFLLGRKTLTPRMVRMLSYSAAQGGYKEIQEVHLVEGFLEDGGSSLELVQALGLESELRRALGEPKVLEEVMPLEVAFHFGAKSQPTPTLDMLGRDLTVEAIEGRLPEIVGREQELRRVINVLLRKEQRNPLLTGEAGVGKTALAIALAQRIATGKVPRRLQGYRVVEINGANLMSGTSYRGDLESRIKGLLDEASHKVILFIDEAHAVFAPRAGSHAPAEVPNHFKSALASGDIAVVAATTESEYRRWIEQDPALRRRFERVEIGEPSLDLVHHILGSLVTELEADYEVEIDPAAIEATIDYSVKFMPEQRLPDKAKKLLMDACIARIHDATLHGEDEEDEEPKRPLVRRADVACQVCLKTGVPLERLLSGEMNWWVGIEERLSRIVVGQKQAISDVARALVKGRLRGANSERPLAVLLFVGPPGVGKGTLASALAEEVFGSKQSLIRLDMTDFQESHSISRLIGSPPGYVGYEDEDLLVTPLRRRPSSVVLLEDMDRAHPQIQERMLRLLREGAITDTRGYKADVRQAIFIVTVNTEAGQSKRGSHIGFFQQADSFHGKHGEALRARRMSSVEEELDKSFAARVRGHVDAMIMFEELGGDESSPARDLLRRHVEQFKHGMSVEYGVEVELGEALHQQLEQRALAANNAQEVEEVVEELLFAPVTERLLRGSGAMSADKGAALVVAQRMCIDWDEDAQRSILLEESSDQGAEEE